MPREDPRYKKKERRKEIFIVVPRRREKIFPFLYFPVRLPFLLLLVLQLQDREDQSGSRCEGISLFFNPIQSSMDGRNEGRGIFFFFLFLVVDTHRAAASQNSTRILVYKTNSETRNVRDLDRKDTIKDPKDFSSRSISSTFFLDVVPRGRATSRMAARRDHLSPPLCICVRFNFFSYKWKAD